MSARAWQRLNWLTTAGWVSAFALLSYPPAFGRNAIVSALCFVVMAAHLACQFGRNRAKRRDVPASTEMAADG